MKKELSIEVTLQILKPADEVFEAIADPAKMTKYFISESSGRIEEGKTVSWKFPEFSIVFPVRGGKSVKPEYISFYWENQGRELLVEFTLKPNGPDKTIVTVTEKSMPDDEAGLKWLKGNTSGWANFLACLKAWMEYGINLRKGAFDYMSQE
jgi:uncharacterized protein YndB with AHSA1/START domain